MTEHDENLKSEILSQLDFRQHYKAEAENFTELGENLARAKCPLCKDATKFYINTKNGGFSCLNCDTSGSFIDFFMKRHQVNYEDALKILTALASTETSENSETDIQAEMNTSEEETITEDEINTDERECDFETPSLEPEKHSEGIYLESELYRSDAFLSLGKNSIKVFIAFLEALSNNGSKELSISFSDLEEVCKTCRSSISGAVSELQNKGFIRIIHKGGSGKGDRNLYSLSGDYKNWVSETKGAQREEIESANENLTKPTDLEEFEQNSKKIPLRKHIGGYFRTLKTALGSY
jgi:hypothetical protein